LREFLVFGFRGDALAELRATVELVLGVRMAQRDGDSSGGVHYRYESSNGECLTLQKNFIPAEQDFAETSFAEFRALLYVEDTERADELVAVLEPFARLLRRYH
jgi:hypothetical protein